MEMDIDKIMSLLPHRYPFLLVDRVLELVPGPTGAADDHQDRQQHERQPVRRQEGASPGPRGLRGAGGQFPLELPHRRDSTGRGRC